MKPLYRVRQFLESLHGWGNILLQVIILIASSFLSYDFANYRTTYPRWNHQIDIFQIWLPIVFFAALGISIFLNILHFLFCRPTIKKLSISIQKLSEENALIGENVEKVFVGYLYQLSRKLSDIRGFSTDRVTIYIYTENNKFIPFGRYAANPNYSAPGRTEYPGNQGCISRGWQRGWWFDNDFTQDYAQKQAAYGVSASQLSALKMQSKLYAVKRIDNGHNPLAVIVVESIESDRFLENEIKQKLEEEVGYMVELIVRLRDHIPTPINAKSKGF